MDKASQLLIFVCLILSFYLADGRETSNQAYDIESVIKETLLNYKNSHRIKNEGVNLQYDPMQGNFAMLEKLLNNSTKCFRDLIYVAQNLKGTSGQWAIKMLDSFGKPGSGVLQGNMKWIGDYTECIEVYAEPNHNLTAGNFHGQYCTLNWPITLSNFTIPITLAVCLPDSCSDLEIQGDILNVLHTVISGVRLNETYLSSNALTCKPVERHMNAPAKFVIALMSIFCFLVILGSSVTVVKYFLKTSDVSSRKSSLIVNVHASHCIEDQNGRLNGNADDEDLLDHDTLNGKFYGFLKRCEPFLNCFCVFHNGAKILNTTGGEGELLCIHGIRFLSMSWVILGHSFAFAFYSMRNSAEAVELAKGFAFQIILQGFFSVDSFFVLSGFLLTYLSMREFAKKGEISWLYFYIHRYIRLTPVYMVVLGFSATVYLYLGSGPFWPDYDVEPICKKYWWRNLLYINNFGDGSQQCMGWSWYLANDMQFFIISPIFLITLWKWPKIGSSLVAIFLCACWLSNFFITYHYDLIAGYSYILNRNMEDIIVFVTNFNDYFQKLYIKPYTRIAPYLIGILTGYILFARKNSNQPKHNRITVYLGWVFASIITLACVYGLYHRDPSLAARSIYNALSRTTFAIGLSWVIYICLMEQGGFVNSILSFKMFIPLSRLTYSAYLIHPLIIIGYYSSLKQLFEYSHLTVVIVFFGAMVITYGLSLLVALVFESPIIALEKLVRSRFTKKREVCT